MSAAIDFDSALRRQVDSISESLQHEFSDPTAGPVITRVAYVLDQDWSGDDAIHFTITLRAPPAGGLDELALIDPMRLTALDLVRKQGIARIPYVSFQLESEHPTDG